MDDLLTTIINLIQYDFCEDDNDVQGNWTIDFVNDELTITYYPFDDSPFPGKKATYRITKLTEQPWSDR